MTIDETKQLLARLIGAYPQARIDEATVLVFAEALARDEYQIADGLEAVQRWIQTEQRFPTVTQLLAAVRACARRSQPAALTAPRPRNWRDVGAAGLAAARAELTAAAARARAAETETQP
jgi:hypothetical protein